MACRSTVLYNSLAVALLFWCQLCAVYAQGEVLAVMSYRNASNPALCIHNRIVLLHFIFTPANAAEYRPAALAAVFAQSVTV